MQRFIVVGTQRTGTNYVRTLLDSHSEILCIGEAFLKTYKDRFSYRTFSRHSPARLLNSQVRKQASTASYLDYLFSQQGYSAIGFKLMIRQHKKNPYILECLHRHPIKFIRVHRQNILATLVSRKISKTYGIYHSKSTMSARTIEIDTDSLYSGLEEIDRENASLEQMCDGFDNIVVTYEKMTADADSVCRHMLNFLGIEPGPELTSDFKKVNASSLEDSVTNYEQVAQRLLATKYAFCVDKRDGARSL